MSSLSVSGSTQTDLTCSAVARTQSDLVSRPFRTRFSGLPLIDALRANEFAKSLSVSERGRRPPRDVKPSLTRPSPCRRRNPDVAASRAAEVPVPPFCTRFPGVGYPLLVRIVRYLPSPAGKELPRGWDSPPPNPLKGRVSGDFPRGAYRANHPCRIGGSWGVGSGSERSELPQVWGGQKLKGALRIKIKRFRVRIEHMLAPAPVCSYSYLVPYLSKRAAGILRGTYRARDS